MDVTLVSSNGEPNQVPSKTFRPEYGLTTIRSPPTLTNTLCKSCTIAYRTGNCFDSDPDPDIIDYVKFCQSPGRALIVPHK